MADEKKKPKGWKLPTWSVRDKAPEKSTPPKKKKPFLRHGVPHRTWDD